MGINKRHAMLDKVAGAFKIAVLIAIMGGVVSGGRYIISLSPENVGVHKKDEKEVRAKIHSFKMAEKAPNSDLWNLEADTVFLNDETRELENVRVRYRQKESMDAPILMTAARAVVRNDTLDIDFLGNVAVRGAEPNVFSTERLYWRQDERRFYTEDDITLEAEEAVITGRGIMADMDNKSITVLESVRAVY